MTWAQISQVAIMAIAQKIQKVKEYFPKIFRRKRKTQCLWTSLKSFVKFTKKYIMRKK